MANVITYRPRSAIRDAAKALGHSPGQQDAFSKQVDGWVPLRRQQQEGSGDISGIPQEIIDLAKAREATRGRRIGLYIETKHPTYFRTIGLPLDEDYDAFVAEAERDVETALGKLQGKARADEEQVTEAARLAARRAAARWSGKKPQVKVMLPVR